MRTVNEKYETIEKPENLDPILYDIWEENIIRPGAIPPDHEEKQAYYDEDYEHVLVIRKRPNQEVIQIQIAEQKRFLSETDYVAIKIMEGSATREKYADILQKREEARKAINQLEIAQDYL